MSAGNLRAENKRINKYRLTPIYLVLTLSLIIISLLATFLCGFDLKDPGARNISERAAGNFKIERLNTGAIENSEVELLDTLVISDPEDPYYPLAEEIAYSEDAILIESVERLYRYYPKYVIWVASPDLLSEEKLLELGIYFKQTKRFPATGIITGMTMKSAEDLWKRGRLAAEGRNYIASDIDLNGGIEEGTIIDVSGKPLVEEKLDKANLVNALKNADYFYWARHVSPTRWFWHKDPGSEEYYSLYAQDIPDLSPVIIHTPSCSSFLPWEENSIAMGFIEKGAAAYLGDLFTPGGVVESGIFIGSLKYLPGKYTWEDFPIGVMAQIQNISMSRVSANVPVFFMLGNPKISLQETKPYKIISDVEYAEKRIIKGRWENKGILPLKIDGGASYSYISIKGLSSVSDSSLFCNSKIQSVNIHSDKYLLFIPEDPEFEIELSGKAPFMWNFYDSIRDNFEFSWVTIGVVQGYISLVFLGIFLLVFLIYKLKKKITPETYLPAIIAGAVIAVLQLLFIIFQSDRVTVSSYIKIYPVFRLVLGFIGTFSTVSGGLILMLAARKKILKVLGIFVCVLPQLILTLFFGLFYIFTNMQFTRLGFPPIWSYMIVYQHLILLIIEVLVLLCIYFISIRFKNFIGSITAKSTICEEPEKSEISNSKK